MPIIEALPPGDMPILRAGPWTFVDCAQSWPRARDMSSAGRPPPCPGAGHEPRLLGPPDMPIIEALPPGTCPFFEPGLGHLWIGPSPGLGRGTCPVRGGPRHALAPDMSRGCPDHRTCPLLKPSLRGHAHFSSRAMDICGLGPVLAPGAGHVQRRVSASCRGRRTCPFVALVPGLPLHALPACQDRHWVAPWNVGSVTAARR